MVRVVAHTIGAAGPTVHDNHWSLYLVPPNNGDLVRMNIMADYGNPTGRLEWTSQAYDLTSSAIRHWDFQAAQGVQVSHVAQLIYNRH
jgi:hypothetical protein